MSHLPGSPIGLEVWTSEFMLTATWSLGINISNQCNEFAVIKLDEIPNFKTGAGCKLVVLGIFAPTASWARVTSSLDVMNFSMRVSSSAPGVRCREHLPVE